MLFEDPIRTISVELPAGWTYNPFNSTLTDFYFTRWDDPRELIGVHVRPLSLSQEESDAQWIERIKAEIGGKAPLRQIASSAGIAVAAEFNSGKGAAQRVAFVRGPRVELVLEQRSIETGPGNLWAPLDLALQTAYSTVNLQQPRACGADEFNHVIETANQAYARQAFSEVVDALQQAIEVGTAAWLYSLAPPVNSPDLNAAARVAQSMRDLSSFTEDPFMQRNSEAVLRRALRALESMGASSEAAQKIKKEITEALDSMVSEIMEGTQEKAAGNLSPILAIRERGFRLAKAGARAFDAREFQTAYMLFGLAVDDLLSLISFLRRHQTQEIPQEIAAHLAGQGITEPAAQKEALQNAREALLLPPISLSLQIRYCCALQLETHGFSEPAEILLSVAKLLHGNNPEDGGIRLHLALSLMLCAGAFALQEKEKRVDRSEQLLDEAARVLEPIRDLQDPDQGWFQYHESEFEITLGAFSRRLAALKQDKDTAEEERLQSFRSRFETLAREFRLKVESGNPKE